MSDASMSLGFPVHGRTARWPLTGTQSIPFYVALLAEGPHKGAVGNSRLLTGGTLLR